MNKNVDDLRTALFVAKDGANPSHWTTDANPWATLRSGWRCMFREHLRSVNANGLFPSDPAPLLARLSRRRAVFEGVKHFSGFIESLCVLEQAHQAQADAGGFEPVTHLADG